MILEIFLELDTILTVLPRGIVAITSAYDNNHILEIPCSGTAKGRLERPEARRPVRRPC